ncbi:hypothetical protein ABPG72_022330 [Tetrahymena utriculariae]
MQQGHTVCWNSKKLKSLSEEFVTDPKAIKHLDVSNNLLRTGRSLERFVNLVTLIIDENQISNLQEFPQFQSLECLSLIKNQIQDLDEFIQLCKSKFPKLSNLNLMKNPVCPTFFLQEEEYHNYRQQLVKNISTLTIIDGFPVTEKDFQPFISEIQPIEDSNQSNGYGKQVIRQQYVENDQARGVVEHNPKYAKVNQNRNILKGTSQGNKHIPNDKL